jgi:hypothetical protein
MSADFARSEGRAQPGRGEPTAGGFAAAAPGQRGPFEVARHALAEWLSHLIVVAGLLLGLHGVEALLHLVGFPLTSVFDAGDAGLIIGFLVYGVYSVLSAYGASSEAEWEDAAGDDRHGRIASSVRLALRPAPASFTFGAFAERLVGHLLVYAVILVASIYLCLFTFAPWPVSLASLGFLLLLGTIGVAVSASRGSLSATLKWLVEIRVAVGSFVAVFALLLLVEELLRRSS